MKQVKIKERFESFIGDFFSDEKFSESGLMPVSSSSEILTHNFGEKNKMTFVYNLSRQLFLYFPGVIGLSSMIFFLTVWHTHPHLGFGIRNDDYKDFWIGAVVFSMMTVAGIANIRKVKSLLIPASVIAFSLIVGLIYSAIGIGEIDLYNNFVGYFPPFSFLVAFATKVLIDDAEDLD
jgi:hypothetical protein